MSYELIKSKQEFHFSMSSRKSLIFALKGIHQTNMPHTATYLLTLFYVMLWATCTIQKKLPIYILTCTKQKIVSITSSRAAMRVGQVIIIKLLKSCTRRQKKCFFINTHTSLQKCSKLFSDFVSCQNIQQGHVKQNRFIILICLIQQDINYIKRSIA